MMAIIYKITNNINGKEYIGFTVYNIEKRWKQHCWTNKYHNYPMQRAIKKYGSDAFVHQILYENKNDEWTLKVAEPFFISLYDTKKNGYNCTDGGEGTLGWKPTDEQRKRMSDSQKASPYKGLSFLGKNHTKEARKKISENAKTRICELNPFYNKTHTNKTKKLIGQARIDEWNCPEYRQKRSKGIWRTPYGDFLFPNDGVDVCNKSRMTIRRWCLNKTKHPEWKFIPND